MDDLRYKPPEAVVADLDVDDGKTAPVAVLQKVRNALIACLACA